MQARVYRTVRFRYVPTSATRDLLTTFKDMVNEAIRIGIEEGIRGRLRFRDRIYKEFQIRYGVLSAYPYSVAEIAWSIVKKNRKWGRKPIAKRRMMKMDSQNYRLNGRILSLPFKKQMPVLIPLDYGEYQRSILVDTSLKRGSVTITEREVIIAFSKIVQLGQPNSRTGVDLNEKSVVCSDGSKYDLSEVVRLQTEYASRRSEFDKRNPLDQRLRRKFAQSRRGRERVRQVLHRIAKQIVDTASAKSQSIVLERLKGLQESHHRGNDEGRRKRGRLARWPYRTLQSFIVYKAAWEGVSVEFVSAAWTSKTCHSCGRINRNLKLTEREWRCPKCGAILDRDMNAAINIERRGTIECLGEARPGAQGKDEAVKGNEHMTTPILQAETLKSSLRPPLNEPSSGSLGIQSQWLQN
jgi:IS605 OrfB family transposase